jgi:hypothetical protein
MQLRNAGFSLPYRGLQSASLFRVNELPDNDHSQRRCGRITNWWKGQKEWSMGLM